jgi:hypothetical protein
MLILKEESDTIKTDYERIASPINREERRGTHMGTFMDSIQDFDMNSLPKTEKVKSLAGSKYLEHLSEINSRIEEDNRRNMETYRKASFCSIG